MPVASHEIAVPDRFALDREGRPRRAARVLLFTCEGCGGRAHFGVGGSPLRALREGDVRLAGAWFCGWGAAGPVCVAAPAGPAPQAAVLPGADAGGSAPHPDPLPGGERGQAGSTGDLFGG